jgi:hypothetical protein
MNIYQITALLLILGSTLTNAGFGAFPWRIYTEKNIQEKLNLLAAQPRRWILTQTLVILGGLTSVAGSISLIPLFRGSQGALLAIIGAVAFAFGHVFWIWHVVLRAVQPQAFAKNELPGWLFKPYSILVLLALAGFGVAFWLQGIQLVLGAGIFLGALVILGLYLKFDDMLPFVYYAMTLSIGLTLLF